MVLHGLILKISKSKYKIRYKFIVSTLIFQILYINVLNYRYFHTDQPYSLKQQNTTSGSAEVRHLWLQAYNFLARLCISRTISCMRCCHRRPLHHNATICENGHILHRSCLNILITCQTVISSHACYIKTFIRSSLPMHILLSVGLYLCSAILARRTQRLH